METRLHSISQTTNATDFIKIILKSSCRVQLDARNLTAPKQPVFLLRALEFQATFEILCYNFYYVLRKIAKLSILEASHWSLKTRQKSYP